MAQFPYLWNGGNIILPKVEWNHLCKVLSTGHVSWGLPSACVSQDCAWPRRWDHPPHVALRELHLDLSAPWASRAHLWNQANFFSHILSAKGQGSPFSPESLGWGPSMPTPIATLQSSTAQQNFLGQWNCSVSVLRTMEANSHEWLLRTWNVVSTIKEQKFIAIFNSLEFQSPHEAANNDYHIGQCRCNAWATRCAPCVSAPRHYFTSRMAA